MNVSSKIYVAGHRGMVGGALLHQLQQQGYRKLLKRSSVELDLRNQAAVNRFFSQEQPEYVFLAAARAGGLSAHGTYRAEFLYDNLMIEANVLHAAYQYGVKKLLFLGSSDMYPRLAAQPIKADALLQGPLEPLTEPYAVAKIAGLKLCQAYRDQYGANFITAVPTNVYGLGDNYHPQEAPVLPALLHRFHQATLAGTPCVKVWGTGTPRREFLFADDLADACVYLMQHYQGREPVNVGTGESLSIRELADLVKTTVGYPGEIAFDFAQPDGAPRKLLDVSALHALGWRHRTSLNQGLRMTYQDFLGAHLNPRTAYPVTY